jgi:nucleoside-diphosphate-sugar epimerase
MRIFLTGATGFIGSHVIPELIAAGHSVLGVTRSDEGAKALVAAGVEPYRGTLEDPASLVAGAAKADAVIHLAFDHDFSRFVENCEKDKRVITAIGEALVGSGKPFVITSGTGMGNSASGKPATEDFIQLDNPNPRVVSEATGLKLSEAGVKVIVVRLPQVHDTRKQGLVSPYAMISKQKGLVGYVGEGLNRWPSAHVSDVAKLYKLAVERGEAGERFNAVDEEGVAAKDIALAIGRGLGVPAVSLTPDEAAGHYGWLAHFLAMDMPASGAWTRERLGWRPAGPRLLEDLAGMDYKAFG